LNNNEYKDIFLNEAREYLSNLNNSLVVLEKDPSHLESIREIFRAAHTLKGMSATMGYEPMTHLTHQMEAVLEPIRSGEKKLTSGLVDCLFACLDRLEKWVKTLDQQEVIDGGDIQEMIGRLQDAVHDQTASSIPSLTVPSPVMVSFRLTDAEKEIYSQARMNGFSIFKVTVELQPECVFKEVRSFMVLKNINELGEIIKSFPSGEDITGGKFDREFTVLLITEHKSDEIRTAIMEISEIQETKVTTYELEEGNVDTSRTSKEENSKNSPDLMTAGEKTFMVPTIRVHTSKLDKLMVLVQELVISKTRFEQVAFNKDLKELQEPLSQLNFITDELQDEIMKVRLIPVKQIFDRFPRMVRDLAKSLNKQVNLEMEGVDVELDRTVIEEMGEPLVHLLRNAIDHGIENANERVQEGKKTSGTIRLQAKRERSFVVISVSDDGKGIDPEVVRKASVEKGLISADDVSKMTDEEAIRLIAMPGFSTIKKVTEVSGRGVGVDVAKTKVESLGGNFRIFSRKGQGTTFILRFPLTLAIIKALLVKSSEEVFAIPVANIVETIDMFPEEERILQQQETLILRDEVIPLYRLRELLELEEKPVTIDSKALESVIIVEVGDSRVGIKVDQILGQQEIAIKSLDKMLKGIRGFSGATIQGNGRIALILDVNSLIEDLKGRRYYS
jgi:two-component system chemotaxis sensor kinase CheA